MNMKQLNFLVDKTKIIYIFGLSDKSIKKTKT